jgi:hypothetical protein
LGAFLPLTRQKPGYPLYLFACGKKYAAAIPCA